MSAYDPEATCEVVTVTDAELWRAYKSAVDAFDRGELENPPNLTTFERELVPVTVSDPQDPPMRCECEKCRWARKSGRNRNKLAFTPNPAKIAHAGQTQTDQTGDGAP